MDDLTILDLREVAGRLHSTVHFVRTLIATDELKYVRIGKKFTVCATDLDAWIRANRQLRSESDEVGENAGKARATPVRRLKSVG